MSCESVSIEGNRCARDPKHEGCHEVYVDGDGRRWWDDTRPDFVPTRQLVIVKAASEHTLGGGYSPPGVSFMGCSAWTDSEMMTAVRGTYGARVTQPSAVYLVNYDGKLREISLYE